MSLGFGPVLGNATSMMARSKPAGFGPAPVSNNIVHNPNRTDAQRIQDFIAANTGPYKYKFATQPQQSFNQMGGSLGFGYGGGGRGDLITRMPIPGLSYGGGLLDRIGYQTPLRNQFVQDVPRYTPQPTPGLLAPQQDENLPPLGDMGLVDFRRDPRFAHVPIGEWLQARRSRYDFNTKSENT